MPMHSLLLVGAARHPDKVAFHWADRQRRLSYARL